MPKNKTGGNKTKKQGNKHSNKKILIADTLDENQLFAQITKKLGDKRYNVLCSDNVERIGRICNKLQRVNRGKFKLDIGSNVIISLRTDCDSSNKKCDMLAFAEPPNNIISFFKSQLNTGKEDEDIHFEFDNEKYNNNDDEDNEDIDFGDI